MAYGIGRSQKLGKQNRKQLENTADTSLAPVTPSYSYDNLNKNTDWNITVVIPPHFDNYIQNQRSSASYASAGANDSALSLFDQSNNHHGNTDGKYNDDSNSYETPSF